MSNIETSIEENNQNLTRLKLLLNIQDNNSDDLLLLFLDVARQKAINYLFPYGNVDEDFVFTPSQELWIVETAKMVYDSKDYTNLIRYVENGIEFEFNTNVVGGINLQHYQLLGVPHAKAVFENAYTIE